MSASLRLNTQAVGRLERSLVPGWLFWPNLEAVLLRVREAAAAGATSGSVRAALEAARARRVPTSTLSAAEAVLAAAWPQQRKKAKDDDEMPDAEAGELEGDE